MVRQITVEENTTVTPAESASLRPVLAANTIPRLPRIQEFLIRVVALLAYGYGLYWLWWRWTSSLNWKHPFFSM